MTPAMMIILKGLLFKMTRKQKSLVVISRDPTDNDYWVLSGLEAKQFQAICARLTMRQTGQTSSMRPKSAQREWLSPESLTGSCSIYSWEVPR